MASPRKTQMCIHDLGSVEEPVHWRAPSDEPHWVRVLDCEGEDGLLPRVEGVGDISDGAVLLAHKVSLSVEAKARPPLYEPPGDARCVGWDVPSTPHL